MNRWVLLLLMLLATLTWVAAIIATLSSPDAFFAVVCFTVARWLSRVIDADIRESAAAKTGRGEA